MNTRFRHEADFPDLSDTIFVIHGYSAEFRDVDELFLEGVACFNEGDAGSNAANALRCFRKAADRGHPEAQFNLGQMYANGIGTKRNFAKAASWCRKAAESGVAEAECTLGIMYRSGKCVRKDDVQAASWFRRAAEQGLPSARRNLRTLGCDGRISLFLSKARSLLSDILHGNRGKRA